ncbi:hypothetical protein [uncultured Methanobrevibacter sp.]|uniref:hypothetical protein n=1 Tax=uncultured Methanobrevibacter sp. TaxID=253161 RepID=UPI0025D22F81|nr:hypothetical protein [uncultured Methanobrevibacter sp.]
MTYYFFTYTNESREFTLNVCTDFGEKMNYYAGTLYIKQFTFKNIKQTSAKFSQINVTKIIQHPLSK